MRQKKTLRQLSPLARELAECLNDLELATKRLNRLVAKLAPVEADARALDAMITAQALIPEPKGRTRKPSPAVVTAFKAAGWPEGEEGE